MNRSRLTLAAALTTLVLAVGNSAQADIIAFDLVSSASQNLVNYTNPSTDAFSNAGDGFQIYQRGVSASIPFAVLDDSVSIFPADTLGVIGESNMDTFFGATDTVNSDTSGPVTAQWDFDVAGFTDLMFSVDLGAMGNFEAADSFSFAYQLDAGAVTTLFDLVANEAISQTYTMEGGALVTYIDPMTVGSTVLSNQLQTLAAAIAGGGSILSIIVTGNLNGSDEAIAFQNMIISGTAVPEPAMLALFGICLVGLGLARRRG